MSQPDPAAELRRLRAALGARAAERLADPSADPARLLADEVRLIERIVTLADAATARASLLALWHDLRIRATTLAAELPPTAEAVALLSRAAGEREGLAPSPRSLGTSPRSLGNDPGARGRSPLSSAEPRD